MMMDKISGQVVFWRQNRRWMITLGAPAWVMADLCIEMNNGPLRQVSYGGGKDDLSMTLTADDAEENERVDAQTLADAEKWRFIAKELRVSDPRQICVPEGRSEVYYDAEKWRAYQKMIFDRSASFDAVTSEEWPMVKSDAELGALVRQMPPETVLHLSRELLWNVCRSNIDPKRLSEGYAKPEESIAAYLEATKE